MNDILRLSYDRSAPLYDRGFRSLQRPKYRTLLGPRAAAIASWFASERPILDVGCGTGLLAEWLDDEGARPAGLIGADLSHEMLRRALRRGVRCAEAAIERLPFRDDTFSVIFAFTALAIVPGTLARAVAEVARVLEPGGVLAVSVLKSNVGVELEDELRARGLRPGSRIDCGQDWGYLAIRA